MQPDFQEFLNDCKLKYKNEYFPFLCSEQEKGQNSLELNSANDDAFSVLGKVIGYNVGHAIKCSDYISLSHLEHYHKWLLENYDIKPKH